MRRYWLLFTQTVTVCLGLLFIVSTLKPQWGLGVPPTTVTPTTQQHEMSPTLTQHSETSGLAVVSYADAIERAAQSVVSISTKKTSEFQPRVLRDALPDPSLHGWVDDGAQRFGSVPPNAGAGIIVDAEGYVLTNYHVIEGASKITVYLYDDRQAAAQVLATDPDSDLAVLKIALPNLHAIPYSAQQAALRVGDVVIAIGYPFGFEQTSTVGIVSGVNRNRLGISVFENYIQTDAAINPGNSGGALINTRGELVGVNTAIYAEQGVSLGIGFAIPAAEAFSVMNDLRTHGKVTRGWLGIEPQDLDADIARSFKLKNTQGIIVARVIKNSPAAVAGMEVGDVITAVNGQHVSNSADLLRQVASVAPQEVVQLEYWRSGKSRFAQVVLQARP